MSKEDPGWFEQSAGVKGWDFIAAFCSLALSCFMGFFIGKGDELIAYATPLIAYFPMQYLCIYLIDKFGGRLVGSVYLLITILAVANLLAR